MTCHKMRHSLSLPTVTCIYMKELPHFHHGPTTSFLHSQQIQTPPSGPGLICAAGQVLIWDDPLSRHSVDRSPRAFHSSTHNVVRASFSNVYFTFRPSRWFSFSSSITVALFSPGPKVMYTLPSCPAGGSPSPVPSPWRCSPPVPK